MYYGTHAAPTAAAAFYQLMVAVAKRVREQPPPRECWQARFPVALLFVRGDRGGEGKKLAEQAIASFDYWDKDTGDSLDIVLAGWTQSEAGLKFNVNEFLAFRKVIEKSSTWTYSGETDLLLLNFVVNLDETDGWFDYSEVIILPLEEMFRNKHLGSLDGFVSELASSARKASTENRFTGNSPVWEMSDHAGILRVKKDLWHAIKKFFLKDYADKLEALENFAVRDVQKDSSPFLKLPFERMREVSAIIGQARQAAPSQ
jgi:hypothetical protein